MTLSVCLDAKQKRPLLTWRHGQPGFAKPFGVSRAVAFWGGCFTRSICVFGRFNGIVGLHEEVHGYQRGSIDQ
jgi:hypothetical protein